MNPGTNKNTPPTRWSLQVVRGQHVGRVFELALGEIILGSTTGNPTGINLADEEGTSPRKMEKRHAAITCSHQGLSIRDLESAGGTFVNRKRLLSQQTFPLSSGDVIQLGAVQLEVKTTSITMAPDPKSAAALTGPPEPRSIRTPGSNPPPSSSTRAAAATAKPSATTRTAPPPPPVAPTQPPPIKPAPPPVATTPPATQLPPTQSGRLPVPFQIKNGGACRSWDDFLTQAAQHWSVLRGELESGRVAEYLRTIGRADLLPRPVTNRSLDEQLDDWLARLPTTVSSQPELDAHPATLEIRQASSGGTLQRTIRVTNVGYRLLHGTARVEPAATPWIRIGADHAGRTFSAIEQTDLKVEIDIPETWTKALTAAVIIETNGGTRSIPVKVEQSERALEPDPSTSNLSSDSDSTGILALLHLERMPPTSRIAIAAAAASLLRIIAMMAARGVPRPDTSSSPSQASLFPIAIAFCALSAFIASIPAISKGSRETALSSAFTAAVLGLIGSAVFFAVIQSVESLPLIPGSPPALIIIWAALGALLGFLSNVIVPFKPRDQEAAK